MGSAPDSRLGGLCVRSGEVNSHIKFVILLTVNNTNLKILVQRIYYWINLLSPNWYFSLFSSLIWLILYWQCKEKFSLGHSWELKGLFTVPLFNQEYKWLSVKPGQMLEGRGGNLAMGFCLIQGGVLVSSCLGNMQGWALAGWATQFKNRFHL